MLDLIKIPLRALLEMGHAATALLDQPLLSRDSRCRKPPVFVFGLPRSGTTLLYQTLIAAFELGYTPNIANTFFRAPLFFTKFGKSVCRPYRTDFRSQYGFEKGCLAPSEAGNIWNRWFPTEKRDGFNYTPAGWLSEKSREQIYELVAGFERLEGAAFLNKNTKTSVRLPALREIFDDARLIRIRRTPLDVALSILKYRRQHELGSNWWTVMPREIEAIRNLPDEQQVAYQVYYLEKTIEEDRMLFGANSYHSVDYVDLCEQPWEELRRIRDFLTPEIYRVDRIEEMVPKRFDIAKTIPTDWISPLELQTIERILAGDGVLSSDYPRSH